MYEGISNYGSFAYAPERSGAWSALRSAASGAIAPGPRGSVGVCLHYPAPWLFWLKAYVSTTRGHVGRVEQPSAPSLYFVHGSVSVVVVAR